MTRPKKTFDCVAYKNAAQQKIDALLQDHTVAEVPTALATLADQGPLGNWWMSVKRGDDVSAERSSMPQAKAEQAASDSIETGP